MYFCLNRTAFQSIRAGQAFLFSMKHRSLYLLLVFLSVLAGWFMGYVNIPYVEAGKGFLSGFAACALAICWIHLLRRLWNRWSAGVKSTPVAPAVHPLSTQGLRMFSILSFALLALAATGWYSSRTLRALLRAAQLEVEALRHDASVDEQKNKLGVLVELIRVLDSARVQRAGSHDATDLENRIVAMCASFSVQREWDPESRSYQALSATRGMLLLALVNTAMDSGSLRNILRRVSFSCADLRNADLRGKDLRGIDLSHANLECAQLESARLDHAGLRGARLVGANLERASLMGTNLISAQLSWAKIGGANLHSARLDSADLSNSSLHKASLHYATLIQTGLHNALLAGADLRNCFLWGTQFSNANLSGANLTGVTISGVQLADVNMQDAVVPENWAALLREEPNGGIDDHFKKYEILQDTLSIRDSLIFRLAPRLQ